MSIENNDSLSQDDGATSFALSEQDSRAILAANSLRNIAADLLEITATLSGHPVRYDPENGADVMALGFAAKQSEHMRSVVTLIDSGLDRDALLISRTMLEGLGQLSYAFADIPERTDQWLWFGLVKDFFLIKEKKVDVSQADLDDASLLMSTHGHAYLKASGKNILNQTGKFDFLERNHFIRTWTTTSLKEMLRESDAEIYYSQFYERASDWIHWGSNSLHAAMDSEGNVVKGLTLRDPANATFALFLACQSMAGALVVLTYRFHKNRVPEVRKIQEQIKQILEDTVSRANDIKE